jgi:hypothetical protein
MRFSEGRLRKKVVGTSSGLRRMMEWTLWKGLPPSEAERKTAPGVRAGYVEAPATPGFTAHRRKQGKNKKAFG